MTDDERHRAMFDGEKLLGCKCGALVTDDVAYDHHLFRVWDEVKEDNPGTWMNP